MWAAEDHHFCVNFEKGPAEDRHFCGKIVEVAIKRQEHSPTHKGGYLQGQRVVREAVTLRAVRGFSNLIQLQEVLEPKLRDEVRAGARNTEFDEIYFAMEKMDTTLNPLLQKKLSPDVVRLLAYEALRGVALLHEMGIGHRDLKPENFLVSEPAEVHVKRGGPPLELKLTDFGLGRDAVGIAGAAANPATREVATSWWRPPENLARPRSSHLQRGREDRYLKFDAWSLGCVLAEIAAAAPFSEPLFKADSEDRVLEKIISTLAELGRGATAADPLVGWRRRFPGAPDELLEIMRGLLTFDSADRAVCLFTGRAAAPSPCAARLPQSHANSPLWPQRAPVVRRDPRQVRRKALARSLRNLRGRRVH